MNVFEWNDDDDDVVSQIDHNNKELYRWSLLLTIHYLFEVKKKWNMNKTKTTKEKGIWIVIIIPCENILSIFVFTVFYNNEISHRRDCQWQNLDGWPC